jgi:hypothetical protein
MFTRTCFVLALVVTTLALLPVPSRVRGAEPPLLVIVGQTFAVNDISLAALKDAFGGQATTVSGKRLIPINHPLNAPSRVTFDRVVLGLEPAAVGRFWVDRRIRAEGNPPTTASSPEIAVRIAASLANAITYGSEGMLNPKVKVITVNGKSAKDAAYPIKR